MKTSIIFLVLLFLLSVTGFVVSAQGEQGDLVATIDQFHSLDKVEKKMIFSSMGVPDVSDFSLANLFAWIIFGSIGFVAFIYGKKQASLKPLVIGILLMVYPYFFKSTLWLYVVGMSLCLLLYFWKD